MSGYMPRVGERFTWAGVEFERVDGPLWERALDGERPEVLFPVVYRSGHMAGERGMMNVAYHAEFRFHTGTQR